MIKLNQLVPGRIYSVVFNGPVKMIKGGKGGVAQNPLAGHQVQKRVVFRLQAISRKGYQRRMERLNPAWKPSKVSSPFLPCTTCLDVHKLTGVKYLRGTPLGIIKCQNFVDGKPASPEQQTIIEAFKESRPPPEHFIRLGLANIEHDASV